MIGCFVGGGLQVCREGFRVREALAVQELGRSDVYGAQKLTCTWDMDT